MKTKEEKQEFWTGSFDACTRFPETAGFRDYIPSLNGWRAFAILLVLIAHFHSATDFPITFYSDAPRLLLFVQQLGNLGVRIFFVLSGFLITHLLLKEGIETGCINLKYFYIRRALRIFPVYFTYLGVVGLLSISNLYRENFSSWFGSFTFTRNIFGTGTLTRHFWSLAVEEQFYLIWPVLLFGYSLWCRFSSAFWVLLIGVVICLLERLLGFTIANDSSFFARIFGEWSILAYADSLAIGCLGAFIFRSREYRLDTIHATLITAVAMSAVFAGEWCLQQGKHGFLYSLIPTGQALAIMLSMWISIFNSQSILFRILNLRFVNWVGLLSYSLYIWHYLFLSENAGSTLGKFWFYNWRIWWIPALAAAVASYYLVEIPVLRLKKRLLV